MVSKSHAKRRQDIKTKLMAAIAMLLVSSIMMVSSTYAWFTLSTAPEVTGITTQVGANGNLEMALLPISGKVDDIGSSTQDSLQPWNVKNTTWGNQVNLESFYGLENIVLYPSALHLEGGKIPTVGSILETPAYGSDGRISQLNPNTLTGTYGLVAGEGSSMAFVPNSSFGVRGIGTSSSMTERQLSYRNARSAASAAMSAASAAASTSLNTNGSNLANIAITHGMGGADESYDVADVNALKTIVADLQNNILPQIETAYMQYILAFAASAATDTAAGNATLGETVWSTVKTAVEADNATITSVLAAVDNLAVTAGATITLPTQISTGIEKYNATVATVNEASTPLNALGEGPTYTWTQLSPILTKLANPEAMMLNGFKVSEVKQNISAIVSSITKPGSEGLVVSMSTGGGVYADIADQCGDYRAQVNIEKVEYNGVVLEDMTATMKTASTVKPAYLKVVGNAVESAGAPSGSSNTVQPLTNLYGYVIDLAFRTNAAESDLLLQQDAVDRIYANDNTNEETMGGGSSMTFAIMDQSFTSVQLKELMKAIKIVFFNPDSGEIICNAALDVDHASEGGDGWTAKMYITDGNSYEEATWAENSGKTYYTKTTTETHVKTTDTELVTGKTYYTAATTGEGEEAVTTYTEVANPEVANIGAYYEKHMVDTYTPYTGDTEPSETVYVMNNAIMALSQNTVHKLSVLVYLDGAAVSNEDVAAGAEVSMRGTMNLQFASSATLVPMEYADLHIPGNGTENNGEAGGGN